MSEQNFSETVRNVLTLIATKHFTQKSLRAFYMNASQYQGITDAEREAITAALEEKIRQTPGGLAKRMFGPKDDKARAAMLQVRDALAAEFDLSNNTVGSGVKTGGDMISGEAYVSVYISYKNQDRRHAVFGYRQKDPSSDPVLEVRLYQTGAAPVIGEAKTEFSLDDFENAKALYREHLIQLGQFKNL